jgi:hypothetical protein
MAVITANDWARVWAKAAIDSAFKAKLETDPLLAYREFRQQFSNSPNSNVLCNDIDAYEVEINVMFSTMAVDKLQEIIDADPPMANMKIEYNELRRV